MSEPSTPPLLVLPFGELVIGFDPQPFHRLHSTGVWLTSTGWPTNTFLVRTRSTGAMIGLRRRSFCISIHPHSSHFTPRRISHLTQGVSWAQPVKHVSRCSIQGKAAGSQQLCAQHRIHHKRSVGVFTSHMRYIRLPLDQPRLIRQVSQAMFFMYQTYILEDNQTTKLANAAQSSAEHASAIFATLKTVSANGHDDPIVF